jgi:hypothetical protein
MRSALSASDLAKTLFPAFNASSACLMKFLALS